MPVLADHPRVHVLGNVAEGRNFTYVIEILEDRLLIGIRAARRWR
jgi:hypothetical protein